VKKSEIHRKLATATIEVHARLHRHDGFNAAAEGTIDRIRYCDLLVRLWGFHRGFEIKLNEAMRRCDVDFDVTARRRCSLIEEDLNALGIAPTAGWPICPRPAAFENRAQIFGSLYVIEGSTLGGAVIARALTPLVGDETPNTRRFFIGYGPRTGAMWAEFLNALDAAVTTPDDEAEAVRASNDTFSAFESWMSNWRGASQRSPAAHLPLANA
jgi:heme oxygenase (biliverdin-IX-beta and delta-forming)